MIKCSNYLCLYWQKTAEGGKCISENIELDISGMCESCIYFIDEREKLDELRSEILKKEKN